MTEKRSNGVSLSAGLIDRIPDESHAYLQPVFRTVRGTVEYIRKMDPESIITEYAVRQAIRDGAIPARRVGNRYVIDVYKVIRYFEA